MGQLVGQWWSSAARRRREGREGKACKQALSEEGGIQVSVTRR